MYYIYIFSNHSYVNINSVFFRYNYRLKCNLNYCETVQEYFIRFFFLYQALSVILYFFLFFFIANRFFHGQRNHCPVELHKIKHTRYILNGRAVGHRHRLYILGNSFPKYVTIKSNKLLVQTDVYRHCYNILVRKKMSRSILDNYVFIRRIKRKTISVMDYSRVLLILKKKKSTYKNKELNSRRRVKKKKKK